MGPSKIASGWKKTRGALHEAGEVETRIAGTSPPVSVAATEIVLALTPGEPVTYGALPSLPADATTMTPRSAALRDATTEGSPGMPKAEPRLMLMTSR